MLMKKLYYLENKRIENLKTIIICLIVMDQLVGLYNVYITNIITSMNNKKNTNSTKKDVIFPKEPNFNATFTSSSSVKNFLPAGGTPSAPISGILGRAPSAW